MVKKIIRPIVSRAAIFSAHTTPKLVTWRHSGQEKALKMYKSFSPAEYQTRKQSIEDYISKLRKIGIPVIKTKVFGTKQKGKIRLGALQEYVHPEFLLSNYLKKCSKEQAQQTFSQILNLIKLTDRSKTVAPDFLINDFAMVNGKLTLIDVFPPVNFNNLNPERNITERRWFTKSRIRHLIMPKSEVARVQANTEELFNQNAMNRRMLSAFTKSRPELKSVFEKIV